MRPGRPARWPWLLAVIVAGTIAALLAVALRNDLSTLPSALMGFGILLVSAGFVTIRVMLPLPVGASALDPAIVHGTHQLRPPREGRGLRFARTVLLAGAMLLALAAFTSLAAAVS